MITAEFTKDTQSKIKSFTISGHAEYDDSGKDIVCSAVTALSFSTINSIEQLLNIDFLLEVNEDHGGYLHVSFEDSFEDDNLQLLLNHLLLGIDSIQEEYFEYIQLKQITN